METIGEPVPVSELAPGETFALFGRRYGDSGPAEMKGGPFWVVGKVQHPKLGETIRARFQINMKPFTQDFLPGEMVTRVKLTPWG